MIARPRPETVASLSDRITPKGRLTMPTDSRTAAPHRPLALPRLRAESRRGALRALLAGFGAMPAHPALCWWFAPYAALVASSRARKP